MNVNDVAFVSSPCPLGIHSLVLGSPCLTLQHFKAVNPFVSIGSPHNCDVRQPAGAESPPSLIFDVAYGYAALNTWGTPSFINFAQTHTRGSYYDNLGNGDSEDGDGGGDDDGGNGSGGGDGGDGGRDGGGGGHRSIRWHGKSSQLNAHSKQVANHQKRRPAQQHEACNPAPDLADMVLGLWMHNARKDMHQACMMKEEQTRESVQTWLQSIA